MSPPEINTVDYEIFYNKFFNIIDEAKEVVRYLSGSTVTRESGEVQVAFYDADTFEASMLSCGILMHIMNVTRCLNYMQEEKYEEDIGIYDGDQFVNNDAYIGGMHVPDTAVLAPYFYRGELVGYVASLSHTTETGGIEPGGMCPSATEAWHDGLILPCVKVIEKGKMRRDIFRIMARGVRDPRGMELDIRARIAGNERAKQRLNELIDEFGVDFFKAATRKLLDDGEKAARGKIRKLVPGIYSSLVYSDAIGIRGDKLAVIYQEMEVTKEGDFIFSYPVVSPQAPSFNNCYLPAVEASIFYILLEKIFYDIRWNSAFSRAVKIEAPAGSRINADPSRSVGYCTVGMGDTLVHAVTESLSLAQYVSQQEIEVEASTGPCNFVVSGGTDQYGRTRANIFFSTPGGSGGGGRIGRDGLGSVQKYNPFCRTADTEAEEFNMPFMNLTINYRPDSGGFGKWRGGTAVRVLYLAHKTNYQMASANGGNGNIPQHSGLYGGYPASSCCADVMLNTNFYDVAKEGRIPLNVEDLQKMLNGRYDQRTPNKPSTLLKSGDIVVCEASGGAGLGDPLERDPDLIKKDVINKEATVEISEKVYCVAIDPTTLKIDYEETKKLREEKRKQRLNRGIPGLEYLKALVEKRKKRTLSQPALECWDELIEFSPAFRDWLNKEEKLAGLELKPLRHVKIKQDLLNITPYIKVVEIESGEKVSVCKICEFAFCKAQENFKLYCLICERDPQEIHPGRSGYPSDWCLYREFYCPGCGTQIEMETIVPGAPIVHHIKLKNL